jgi:hypothetical protein
MTPTRLLAILLAIFAATGMGRYRDTMSDQDLIKYAKPFHGSRDFGAYPKDGAVIGTHRGMRVLAEVRCSDLCPDYTRLVIHYDEKPGLDCRAAGGSEVEVLMPFAIAVRPEKFCVPAILVEGKLYTAP